MALRCRVLGFEVPCVFNFGSASYGVGKKNCLKLQKRDNLFKKDG